MSAADDSLQNEIAAFEVLKERLPDIWRRLQADPAYAHTSVIAPSLSVNQEELAKVHGAAFYEERLLFALIRLKNPNARVIYLTSQPVHPEIVDYYLQLLDGISVSQARQRLHMVSVHDASSRPLSEKLLERPRLLTRLRKLIGDPQHAYLTCYNATVRERALAVALDIPLNGVDPALLDFGTKSGSRQLFRKAGVPLPPGYENLRSRQDIVGALRRLGQDCPDLRRAVVKLNEGFSGEGNGLFVYPEERDDEAALDRALDGLRWPSGMETTPSFMRKFAEMGGIVEAMIDADEARSPSVQMRIFPNGEAALVSTHEQVLGGTTGQVYLGCRFPANDDCRSMLQAHALNVAQLLAEGGVIGRFGVDFLVTRKAGADWQCHAIEINLRMGGTTPPFHALEFLTGGGLDADSGLFVTPEGKAKFYSATDNLKSPAYRGLLPEDLFEIARANGLSYRHSSGTGVLFYMIGALSQYGKVGMTCIGDSPEQAQDLFERTADALDAASAGDGHGRASPLLDRYLNME